MSWRDARKTPHRDENHGLITKAFEAHGATVQDLSMVGDGCTDILVGYRGWNLIVEIKNPKQKPSARKLRKSQREWAAWWRGAPAHVAETVEDVGRILKQYANPRR